MVMELIFVSKHNTIKMRMDVTNATVAIDKRLAN